MTNNSTEPPGHDLYDSISAFSSADFDNDPGAAMTFQLESTSEANPVLSTYSTDIWSSTSYLTTGSILTNLPLATPSSTGRQAHQTTPVPLTGGSLPNTSQSLVLASPSTDEAIMDVPTPSATVTNLLTPGSRRLVLSTLRTYPRKMAKTGDLPPFVHPAGRLLHYDGRNLPEGGGIELHWDWRGTISQAGEGFGAADTFQAHRPLMACHGVAHLLVASSKSPGLRDFVWKTVAREQAQISREVGSRRKDPYRKRC